MCHFITATMSPSADEAALRRHAEGALLKWEPLQNPSVEKLLLPGERYFLTTRGMCDCGTSLGLTSQRGELSPLDEADYTRDIKKYRKRGWSQAKIDRWLSQLQSDRERKIRAATHRPDEVHSEIDRWVDFISAALQGQATEWISILLHFYHGPLSERISLKHR